MTAPDPSDLFRADSLCMTAGTLFIRAVTATEAGRDKEAAEFVAAARAALGKALIASSPVTVIRSLEDQVTRWSDQYAAEVERHGETFEALNRYRAGVLEAFDGLCPTCRGTASVSPEVRSRIDSLTEKR